MTKKVCFYNRKNHCTKKLTKEHVVSNSVLKALELVGNGIVKADVMNNVPIIDYEPIVKDVCSKCNNESLSCYDESGRKLAEFLKLSTQNNPLTIPFGNSEFGWLLKTHLNFFRVVKDRLTGEPFKVSQKLKNTLVDGKQFDNSLCFFLARQKDNSRNYWDDESDKKVPNFHYNSKRILFGDLIYSHFQIRQLDTILFFPIDANYKNFSTRFEKFIEQWKSDPLFQSQVDLEGYELIDIDLLVKRNYFPLTHVMSPEMLDERLEQAFSAEDGAHLTKLIKKKSR
ncbi:hypothetical protein AKJ18_02535 [Vibrio xuii]|nr:hypothetical protein AKJ18_02535 [Vibrio xuii]